MTTGWLPFVLCGAVLMPPQEDAPIRVSVTLVQVDAVVTGRDGKQVRDLTKDDFEVLEDGTSRPLRYVTYIRSSAPGGAAPRAASTPPLGPSEVGRTIALLVDDLRMSFEGLHHARLALHQFVDRQMEPGDLVAVFSTSNRITALQPFTTNRRQLHAAIDRLRFLMWAGGANGSVAAIGSAEDLDPSLGSVRQRRFHVGMMAKIRYVARGMRGLPGRKSLVLFSEGFQIARDPKADNPSVTSGEIFRLAEEANRSAVVVYGLDVRGLVVTSLQASDDVGGLEALEVRAALDDRAFKLRDSQSGLALLARQTGGTAFTNDNDLSAGLSRMLEDQSGYYLLGYGRPEEDAGKQNRVTVRLKRSGLQLRFRKGDLGAAETSAQPGTVRERLFYALASPFASGAFAFRLSPSFAFGEDKKLEWKALVSFDASQLSLGSPDSSGFRAAKVHIMTLAEGEEGMAGDPSVEAYTIRMKEGEGSFVYGLRHEVRKPGAYQLRVAILDEASGRVGSATRLIELPDVANGAVAMSAIHMLPGDWRTQLQTAPAPAAATSAFRRGQPFSYGVTVYNARPGTSLEPRLLRGSEVVWEGKRIAVAQGTRAPSGGVLTLGDRTAPGDYELELRVVDQTGRPLAASQSVEFELR